MFNFPPWCQHQKLLTHLPLQAQSPPGGTKHSGRWRSALDYKIHFLIFCSVTFKDGNMWISQNTPPKQTLKYHTLYEHMEEN